MESEFVPPTCPEKFLTFLRLYWRTIWLIVWPLLILLIFIVETTPRYRCLYVTLLMAGYWLTEALPLSLTSIIPVVLFPMMDVLDSEKTCKQYMNDTNIMLIGGIMIAIAIEYSNLHNRIAMKIILSLGCSLRKLHFSMSVVTMAVSMWITNTAATAMMMPVISAVLTSLQDEGVLEIFDKQIDPDESPKPKRIPTAFFLTAAFSSTIGGVGTLIGTGTNMTFKGILETAFPKAPQSSFVTWSVYTFPATIGSTLLTILWLQLLFMGLWRPSSEEYKIATNKKSEEVTRKVIEQKYKALGPIVWHEIVVGVMFLLAMLLWLFRQPHFIPGWADLISVKTSDSIPALIPIILMFIIPAQLEFLKHLSDEDQPIREKLCLNWELITKKTPWGLLFLLGGGFALSTGGKESGMSLYLSNKLLALESLPHFVIVGIMCLAAKFGSELMSNVAIANIILPVVVEMSVGMRINPIYFMVPITVFCSFAFHLPVGTPPNAIVSEGGHVKTVDMMIGGLGPTVATFITFLPMWLLYGAHIYEATGFPSWAEKTNGTRLE